MNILFSLFPKTMLFSSLLFLLLLLSRKFVGFVCSREKRNVSSIDFVPIRSSEENFPRHESSSTFSFRPLPMKREIRFPRKITSETRSALLPRRLPSWPTPTDASIKDEVRPLTLNWKKMGDAEGLLSQRANRRDRSPLHRSRRNQRVDSR